MAFRASVNQVLQIGPESTPGTPVAASKLISAWTNTLGEKATTKQFTGSGRKFPAASELLTEMSEGKISGQGDYAALVYPFSSVFGKVTAVLHSPSSTVYDWIWTPALSGAYNPQTYTLQNGDSNDAEQYAFVTFTGLGYSLTREQEVTITGDWIGQTFTDGATLTSSPTSIALLPQTGAQFNVYLDTTSGGVGTTLLSDVMKVDFTASNYYSPLWVVKSANTSFTGIVDTMPKNELKITLIADSTAVGYRASYLQTGTRCYVRVIGTGAQIDAGHSLNAGMTHDMACFISDMSQFEISSNVYVIEYTLQVAEDTAWNSGTAQKLTITNLQSAL